MINKIKYWLPLVGVILFHFDFLVLHNIDMAKKYPLFVIYHLVFTALSFAALFNLLTNS